MRLLFTLINFPPSNFGGIATSMFPIIEKLSAVHEVDVLTTSYKPSNAVSLKYNTWINSNDFRVMYMKTKGQLTLINYVLFGLRILKNYDQIHLNSLFFFPNLIFAFYAILIKKKIYWSFHGELLKPALKIKYWKKYLYLFFIKMIKDYLNIRATSEDEALRIKKVLGNTTVRVIPNFFDIEIVNNPDKKKQLLFLGRICPIKKIENLVIACSKSKLFIETEYKLIIAGPIDDKFKSYLLFLKKQIADLNLPDRIFIVGNLLSPEKEVYLANSKALFLVSDSENFGNVVIEALAHGTPVIAAKGTPWSSLEKTESGFWIDNSPLEIALTIDRLISLNDNKYKEMCKNASNLAKNYSSEFVMKEWVEFIYK